MIAKLSGVLDDKRPGEALVDCGGVGYAAATSLSTFARLPAVGEPVVLWIVTNLRENALELFGFVDQSERRAFEVLRGVNGVGPRLALAILSGIEAPELATVVANGDAARLVAIPGVGRKIADRLLVELKDKLELPSDSLGGKTGVGAAGSIESDAVAALLALGYKQHEASRAVAAVREGDADGAEPENVEALIRRALARLAA